MAQRPQKQISLVELLSGPQVLAARWLACSLSSARQGFPLAVIKVLLDKGVIEPRELYAWIVPRRTLAYRRRRSNR